MKRSERVQIFVEEIAKWYAVHKRELPWRDLPTADENERAYQILVSEVMLQQTQVERVKIVFKNFLNSFPQMKHLAAASNRDVIMAWRGMGYNSRALRLRDAALSIHTKLGGVFPREMQELTSIKGIGAYTGAAIRNFAFNLPTPCLDTNIRRILHRVFVGPETAEGTWEKDDRYLLEIAEECLAATTLDARNWHAALMDFGSLVCTKRNPKWDICPLTKKGIMKAAFKTPRPSLNSTPTKEPGRFVGSTYIPNRIFRGRIVEELRDEPSGLQMHEIGSRICIDWSPAEHQVWLQGLVEKLTRDSLVRQQQGKILLAE